MTVEMYSPFRARMVRSTSGHVIRFGKNETKNVPDVLVDECLQCGIVPKSEVDSGLGVEDRPAPAPEGSERDVQVQAAISTIMGRKGEQYREDWAASGNPAKQAVSQIVGYNVDQRVINRIYRAILDEAKEAAEADGS